MGVGRGGGRFAQLLLGVGESVGVPVAWEVLGNGVGGAGMSPGEVRNTCGLEGPQEVTVWEGKAGKAAACPTATLGLMYRVRCFQMGKPNHWTWLCLERHV